MKKHHVKELQKSAIAQEIIDLNFRSVEGDTVYEYLAFGCTTRRNDGRLPQSWLNLYKHCEQGGWWAATVDLKTGEDSLWGCFKPDSPRIDPLKGTPKKYEVPKGVPTDIFAFKVGAETIQPFREKYGITNPDNFWGEVLANTAIPIVITEGGKKAAAILSAGYIAIGLPGVWSGYRRELRATTHGLIPSLTRLAGHPVYFAFDQDAKFETRAQTARAIETTAGALAQFGCRCFSMSWPESCKGADDLLAEDPDRFELAFRYAKELDLSPESKLKEQVGVFVEQGLSGSGLGVAIATLSKRTGQPSRVIRELYGDLLAEAERAESKEEVWSEIDLIEQASGAKLDLFEVLPHTVAAPLTHLATMLNLRPEVYLTALLVGLSSVGSPKTKLTLHHNWGWEVSAGLYGGIVASSSQKKSPVIRAMISKPLSKIQSEEKEAYEAALQNWKTALDRFEALTAAHDEDGLAAEFPEGPPQKPARSLRYASDFTGEGLKKQLVDCPNQGLLALVDELVGLFKSANQYRGGRGSDLEDLLSLYDGSGVSILRKTEIVDVPQALFSIFGSTQPEILRKWIDDGKDSNGQWGRFIFCYQPVTASLIDDDQRNFVLDPLIEWLYRQKIALPVQDYTLSPEAFEAFKNANNYYEVERVKLGEGEAFANVLGKNIGRIGKFAITLHELKYIERGEVPPPVIELDTIQQAIKLTAFYSLQTQYLYRRFSNDPGNLAPSLWQIMDLANRLKEPITPRLAKKYRICETTEQSIGLFKDLEEMGLGVVHFGRTVKFVANSLTPMNPLPPMAPEEPAPQEVATVTDYAPTPEPEPPVTQAPPVMTQPEPTMTQAPPVMTQAPPDPLPPDPMPENPSSLSIGDIVTHPDRPDDALKIVSVSEDWAKCLSVHWGTTELYATSELTPAPDFIENS